MGTSLPRSTSSQSPAREGRSPASSPRTSGQGLRGPLASRGLTVSAGAQPAQDTEAATREFGKTFQSKNLASATTRAGLPQPVFTPVVSDLLFGLPADISMGWDGTVWAIDISGAPHIYDPVANTWQAFGEGVDAAAWIGDMYYWFRGNEFVTADVHQTCSAPATIASKWPTLPYSFTLGVTGAANVNGSLTLFKSGMYLPADMSSPSAKLIDLANWPQVPEWVDGVIDAVCSDGSGTVMLFRSGQYITADLVAKTVVSGPASISSYAPWSERLPNDWTAGFDAAFTQPDGSGVVIYKGPALLAFDGGAGRPATPQYLAAVNLTWPVTWNPALTQAPCGIVGALWSTATSAGGNATITHDGTSWSVAGNGQATSISAGADGCVLAIGLDTTSLYQWTGTAWNRMADPPAALRQVAVGNAGKIWVRDTNNNVYGYSATGSYSAVNLAVSDLPTHIAANADGTLWHCNENRSSVYRFISEATVPSEAMTITTQIVGVQKVASTGFGTAHCLVQEGHVTNLYRYDSPYIFKTSQSYPMSDDLPQTLVQGLGNLYLMNFDSPMDGDPLISVIVAVDAHTGAEVARSQQAVQPAMYTGLTFDPVNELLYASVGMPNFEVNGGRGQLLALDPRSLEVVWTFEASGPVDTPATLNGTQLCFGDRLGTIYMFNTRGTGGQPPGNGTPQPVWTWTVPIPVKTIAFRWVAPPLIVNGLVQAPVWALGTFNGNEVQYGCWLASCDAVTSANQHVFQVTTFGYREEYANLLPGVLTQPVFANMFHAEPPGTGPSLVLNCGNSVWVSPLDDGSLSSYALPAGNLISTALTYDGGVLWFADTRGTLYGLTQQLEPVSNTPFAASDSSASIFTQPVVYRDPTGQPTVLFGVYDVISPSGSLFGFDPGTGNLGSIATGVTQLFALSKNAENGVVYAGGAQSSDANVTQPSRLFGIRVDALPQALRDFIIESELMQDYNDPAVPNEPPPATARYQTHVTVVDDSKAPRPREAIKLWADKPDTQITVGTQAFTVGPGAGDYAAVQTDVEGKISIYSNATDVFATTLRVWANFMDPYERMVIYPDQEFHARVTTAHANAADDDPDKVNLDTAANYGGAPLFNSHDKSQGQPANVAHMLHTMSNGIGLGGSSGNSTSIEKLFRRAAARVRASTDPYVAYDDLSGAKYSPVNVPASRLAAIQAPFGLSFSLGKSGAPEYTEMSHTDAAAGIDALQGLDWTQTEYAAIYHVEARRLGNWWTAFWDWLKGAVATITHFFVSVGEAIYAGIRFIVNGIEHVFKAIVHIIDEVVAAIVSVFKELLKIIEDVIEAFSVLLHFGEIKWTQQWLASQITGQVEGIKKAVVSAIPIVDGFFKQGEDAIKTVFDQLRKQIAGASLDSNVPLSGLPGGGSTAHTVYSVGPKGGQKTSHAVKCSWPTEKMKAGMPSASSSSSTSAGAEGEDPISDFITGFVASITGDGALGAVLDQFKQDVSNLFSATSAKQFFETLLLTLLDALETILEGALAIGDALAVGILGAFDTIVDLVMGLLTDPIEIPVLSALYKWLFGEPLTFLNLLTLVAAIPVTIIYRVAEGVYPSQALSQEAASVQAGQLGPVAAEVLGVFAAIVSIAAGIIDAVSDTEGDDPPPILGKIVLGVSFVAVAVSFPMISGTPTSTDWAIFGVSAAAGVLNVFGVFTFQGDAATVMAHLLPALLSILSTGSLALAIVAFVQAQKKDPDTDIGFAEGLISALPGMINPLKLLGEELALVVGVVDGIGGFVVGGLQMYLALEV